MKRICQVFITIAACLVLVCGCTLERDRSDAPRSNWSKGLLVGRTNLKQPVATAIDAENNVHLVWCNQGLYYAVLDYQGKMLFSQQLETNTPSPRKPQLVIDKDQIIHLAWLTRVEGKQELEYGIIEGTNTLAAVQRLSMTGEHVDSFQMYIADTGKIAFVWSGEMNDQNSQLVHRTLNDGASRTVWVEQGIAPQVFVDIEGQTHLVWLEKRGNTSRLVYYARVPKGEDPVEIHGQRISDFEFTDSAVYYGPYIGVEAQHFYVFWSIQNLGGGLTPTSAFSYYVDWDDAPTGAMNARPIGISPNAEPDYESYASAYGDIKIDLLSDVEKRYGSDFVNAPAPLTGHVDGLPVMFSMMTYSKAGGTIQIASGFFEKGELVGYQLATRTKGASLTPVLCQDAEQGLHLVWLETVGFGAYDIYYASTAPAPKQWLNRTSTQDIAFGIAAMLWGMLSGIGLLPIAGVWFFAGMVWVVGYFTATGHEDLAYRGGKIGFAISVIIYVIAKLLFLPGLAAGTPFVTMAPRSWAPIISTFLPLGILLASLGAVYIYAKRKHSATIFGGYLTFALTDMILTLFIYAPGLFGT